jgi:hypothetical protein
MAEMNRTEKKEEENDISMAMELQALNYANTNPRLRHAAIRQFSG